MIYVNKVSFKLASMWQWLIWNYHISA